MPPIFAPKIIKKQDGMLAFLVFPSSTKNDDFRDAWGVLLIVFFVFFVDFAILGAWEQKRGKTVPKV